MKTTIALAFFSLALCYESTTHATPVTFDWATVGNPGNDGELSGSSVGFGPEVIVGGVDYTYNISKHEVTAGQYTQFLNAVAASDPNGLYNTNMLTGAGCKIVRSGTVGSYSYSVTSDQENRPVNYVSYIDAMRFTNWLENGQPTGDQNASTTEDGVYAIGDGLSEVRATNATYFIPTEDEWYKAAYHKNDGNTGNYYDYPTSSDSVPSNDLLGTDPGNNANFYDSGQTIGSPYFLTEVGDFENSESPYGTFDQGGNVREWNETLITAWSRIYRGGTFQDSAYALDAAYRFSNGPTHESNNLGFRVASIPEPSTLLLGAIASVGLLVRSRR